jgi:hypothetical protein
MSNVRKKNTVLYSHFYHILLMYSTEYVQLNSCVGTCDVRCSTSSLADGLHLRLKAAKKTSSRGGSSHPSRASISCRDAAT